MSKYFLALSSLATLSFSFCWTFFFSFSSSWSSTTLPPTVSPRRCLQHRRVVARRRMVCRGCCLGRGWPTASWQTAAAPVVHRATSRGWILSSSSSPPLAWPLQPPIVSEIPPWHDFEQRGHPQQRSPGAAPPAVVQGPYRTPPRLWKVRSDPPRPRNTAHCGWWTCGTFSAQAKGQQSSSKGQQRAA